MPRLPSEARNGMLSTPAKLVAEYRSVSMTIRRMFGRAAGVSANVVLQKNSVSAERATRILRISGYLDDYESKVLTLNTPGIRRQVPGVRYPLSNTSGPT